MPRFELAEQAVDLYESDPHGEPGESAYVDLIADVLLLAQDRGEDAEAILRMASGHFEEESGNADEDDGEE